MESSSAENDFRMKVCTDFSDALSMIAQFRGAFPAQPVTAEMIAGIIGEIDRRMGAQINLILHHESFQRLEGTWRGLYFLVSRSPAAADIHIRVFNLSLQELSRCLKKYPGTTWDQSPLFKQIYENEFGTAGGEPFGCLIGDYFFNETPPSVETMKGIARIASAAHVPFIAGASPSMLNMDSWNELANPRDYDRIFNSAEYAAWQSFRDNPDSRYIALSLPRVLARVPYGAHFLPVCGLDFEEETGSGGFCWMNSAYLMGCNVIHAYAQYGWCVRISGNDIGCADYRPWGKAPGADEDLPVLPRIETAITDQRETELSRNGFLVLYAVKNCDRLIFQEGQTVYQPKRHASAAATKNEELASKLPCIFAVSRFAHYIKCILRDKVGGFPNTRDIEIFLNDWLSNYVAGDPDAADEIKAKYPLAEAVVHVARKAGSTDHYEAAIYIRPHYQMDGLATSIRLTAQIPERDKA